jgi:hypothetical protein
MGLLKLAKKIAKIIDQAVDGGEISAMNLAELLAAEVEN